MTADCLASYEPGPGTELTVDFRLYFAKLNCCYQLPIFWIGFFHNFRACLRTKFRYNYTCIDLDLELHYICNLKIKILSTSF